MSNQQKKQLSISHYLQGLDDLHDPSGSTIFTYTIKLFSKLSGELDWIEKKLPAWSEFLNENSGGRVVSLELKRPSAKEGFVSKIILKMTVPGGIKTKKLQNETAKILTRGIKKELAQEVEKNFSPHFDPQKSLFCAGSIDNYFIIPPNGVYFTDDIFSLTTKDQLSQSLNTLVDENGAIPLKCFFSGKDAILKKSFITVEWKGDITSKTRSDFAKKIEKILRSSVDNDINVRAEKAK